MLAPFAPHICEELWHRLGHEDLVCQQAWPTFDEALTKDESVEIAVQVKGKVRGRLTVAADATDDEIIAAAQEIPAVAKDLAGKPIRKSIVVKGRLVNLIV